MSEPDLEAQIAGVEQNLAGSNIVSNTPTKHPKLRVAAAALCYYLSTLFGYSGYYSFTTDARFHELAYGTADRAYNSGMQFLGISLIAFAGGTWFIWPVIKKYVLHHNL